MRQTERAARVRDAMADVGCDALVVTKLENIRWLTGFTGSAALVVVLDDRLVFTTDGRYGEQSEQQLHDAGIEASRTVAGAEGQKEAILAALEGVARIGLEADDVSWARQRRWADEWFASSELVATEGLVDGLRIVKEPGEVDRIEAACAVADAALARVRPRLAESPTEAEFALELDFTMRRLGAQDVSFDTIVAAGPNGAMAHHHPGERRITEGDLVVLDFGALVDGYCSDMTRTIMVGDASPTQQRMLDVVGASQAAGVDAVVAGATAGDVDKVCRDIIDAAGWGDAFMHSTGHGVGLEIHEHPAVAAGSTARLVEGAVVTVEPGVYLPEHGGVRIEDTVVVTSDGCRVLTCAPKTTAVR
ncbi:MAG: aminopeptidase P family protein [Actinobacteria bacterium]|nr:aminopeptidase P family protein [Actinomycetota bacterium]